MGVARAVLLFVVCAALGACQYAQNLNRHAYQQYHGSRWRAATLACAGQAEYAEPGSPATPRLVDARGIDDLYAALPGLCTEQRSEFSELLQRSEVSTQFVAEMLNVLSNRDTTHIEHLAAQIDDYFAEQEAALSEWRDAFASLADAVEHLEAEWEEVWPDNKLDFDLAAALARLRAERVPELTEVRRTALARYHDNEYNRQAMIYLDYDPGEFDVLPKSHVPEGCDALAGALRRQEAGLLVRYSLDQAIGNDVDLVQRLALVDLSQTPWEDVTVPRGRYAEPRVAAAIARLKLLKYIDELLSASLDVFLFDVNEEWEEVWPGHQLETNIFSFAGLSRTDGLVPRDPTQAQSGVN